MSSLAILSAKPWDGYPAPDQIYLPRGMIGFEERRMLYWLASEYYAGVGTVVDAGAYLGASALALGLGLSVSKRRTSPQATVHSYDRFIASDDYVRDDIARTYFLPANATYDYFPLFEFNTALCRERIVPHRGDFMTAPVPQSQIEIMFIDVAKNNELNNRILEHYFPRLIPERSVVVQQDYCQAWYPYIPISMEYLRDYFAVVDSCIDDNSRVYLLTRKIPEDRIKRLLQGLEPAEEAELLRQAIRRDEGLPRIMLRMVQILHMVDREGRRDEARKALAALRADTAFEASSYYASQLDLIEQSRILG